MAPSTNTNNSGQYSSVAQKLMAKMGHTAGKGLGKTAQGRIEPVTASSQRGRRGLGMILKGLEDEKVDWDPSQEVVEVDAQPEWLPECTEPCPPMQGKEISQITLLNIKYDIFWSFYKKQD